MKVPYGPYIIEKSLIWLPQYLDAELLRRFVHPYYKIQAKDQAEFARLQAFKKAAQEVLANAYKFDYLPGKPTLVLGIKAQKLIRYAKGGDPIFNLRPGEPARMAVTGSQLNDPIIFNLGLISDPKKFSYGDAIALVMHEIGHKVKLEVPEITQQEIDEMGASVGRVYGALAKVHEWSGQSYLVIAPVPRSKEGHHFITPYDGLPMRIPSTFAAIHGTQLIDLSQSLDQALDNKISPHRNFIETERRFLNFQLLNETADHGEFLIELRTVRTPKDRSFHLLSDDGVNHFRSAVIQISKDLQDIKARYYEDQPAPTQLILDAEASIEDLGMTLDGGKVTGKIIFYLKNETHYHAMGYPRADFILLALLDGRPVRIEADVHLRMTPDVHGMPQEVYKKPTIKEGRFSFEIANLKGHELELIGVQSRFFELGRGFVSDEDEQKRIRLRDPAHIALMKTCEERLESPHLGI